MENSMEVSQKSKKTTTYGPAIPPLVHVSEGEEVSTSKRYLYPHVHCIIHKRQDMESASNNERMHNDNVVCIHNARECYSAWKKKELFPVPTTRQGILLSEIC
jgi:hypothetical protein